MRKLTSYERALLAIVKEYEDGDYTTYELRIERAAKRFNRPEWQVEDDATIVRMFGIDC